jgi:hypothetical protein
VDNEDMSSLDLAVSALDAPSRQRVRPVLAWLLERGAAESTPLLASYLSDVLPTAYGGDDREQHEVAWALGDLYDAAGLPEQAALCRSAAAHETLAVWHWIHSFPDVPTAFWLPALKALQRGAALPARAALSLSSTRALLEAVGEGLVLTPTGELPRETVLALDDRFRWTEEFPWIRPGGEGDIPPLSFLHRHVVAQRLLERDGDRLVLTRLGEACLHDTGRLWRTMVDPAPRWSRGFERDALGVLAASVLRSADFALGRLGEELAHVLSGKWRPARQGSLFDGVSLVAQTWYQTGVPLGWWDTGRGPADRRPNVFGRAAAVAVFRAVAGPAQSTEPRLT